MFTETFDKQYPIALMAIGHHMQAHNLPAPLGIEVDDHPVERIEIRLGWSRDRVDAWLDSVVVDAEHNTYVPAESGRLEPYFRTRFDVRLPDIGVRLVLVACRQLPLALVSEGGAR